MLLLAAGSVAGASLGVVDVADRANLLARSLISARDLVVGSLPPIAPISVLSGVCSDSRYSTVVLSLASGNPSSCVSAVFSSKTGG